MDTERDSLVDEEEIEAGLKEMFPPTAGQNDNPFGEAAMLNPGALFAKIDADQQGRLVLSDFEVMIMPKIR